MTHFAGQVERKRRSVQFSGVVAVCDEVVVSFQYYEYEEVRRITLSTSVIKELEIAARNSLTEAACFEIAEEFGKFIFNVEHR